MGQSSSAPKSSDTPTRHDMPIERKDSRRMRRFSDVDASDFTASTQPLRIVKAKELKDANAKPREYDFTDPTGTKSACYKFSEFSNKRKIAARLPAISDKILRHESIRVHYPLDKERYAVRTFKNASGFTFRSLLEAFYKVGLGAMYLKHNHDASEDAKTVQRHVRHALHATTICGFTVLRDRVYIHTKPW